jgi:hypothetical protein
MSRELLYCCFTAALLALYWRFTGALLLLLALYCCFSAVFPLLSSCFTAARCCLKQQ